MSEPRIRTARVEDAEGITRCHVGGWKVHYRGIMPQAYLDAMDYDERLAVRRRVLAEGGRPGVRNWVIEQEGEIRGWAAAGPARDADLGEETHELYAIYMDPERVGQGLGRALMAHCLEDARARGFTEMVMWVLCANERAQRFYRAAGFAPDPRVPETPHGDTGVHKMRMSRRL